MRELASVPALELLADGDNAAEAEPPPAPSGAPVALAGTRTNSSGVAGTEAPAESEDSERAERARKSAAARRRNPFFTLSASPEPFWYFPPARRKFRLPPPPAEKTPLPREEFFGEKSASEETASGTSAFPPPAAVASELAGAPEFFPSAARPLSVFSAAPQAAPLAETTTQVYDGGVNAPWSYGYNWGLGYLVFRQWMFGSQYFANDGRVHCVFREDAQGTVVISGEVNPASVTIESGDYVFDQKTQGVLLFGGSIAGDGSLTVERGASLSLNEKNTYSGDTVLRGSLSAGESGVLGSGAVRIETGGALNLNGNTLDNSALAVAGTLILGDRPDAAGGERAVLTRSDALAELFPGGRIELGGERVSGNFTLRGGSIRGNAESALGGNVSVAVADGDAHVLSGASLDAGTAEFSGGANLVLTDGARADFASLNVDLRGTDAFGGDYVFAKIDASAGNAETPSLAAENLTLTADDAEIAALVEAEGEASFRFASVADVPESGSASDYLAGAFASIRINDGSRWRGVFDAETGRILITAVPEPSAFSVLLGVAACAFAAARRSRVKRISPDASGGFLFREQRR